MITKVSKCLPFLLIGFFFTQVAFAQESTQPDTISVKDKFKNHFFKGVDHFFNLGVAAAIPRKEYKDKLFAGAGTGFHAELEAAFLFAEYFGLGIQIPFVLNGNNIKPQDLDPPFETFTSESWRGGGFLIGPIISIPIYPVIVDIKFYPGYMQFRLPRSEGIYNDGNDDFLLVQESAKDGGFAFTVAGSIRYPVSNKFHIGLSVGKTNVRFKFKDVENIIDGELFEKVEVQRTVDYATVGFNFVKSF